MPSRSFAAAMLGGIAVAGCALCAAQAATVKPVATEKPRPVTFDNWALNCQNVGKPDAPVRLCEVVQSIVVEGQKEPIARIAIGRLSVKEPWHATLMLPTNISLPSVVHMEADNKAVSLDFNWTRCTPGACLAEIQLPAGALKQWPTITGGGKVTFTDAGGRAISFPMSFKGLAPALDALEAES